MSIENAASKILQRAITLDNQKRFTESLVCYQEGLQLLVDLMKVEMDVSKKNYLHTKIEGYMNRAEQIKSHIDKQKSEGSFHEQLHIDSNSTGHSYSSLFGRFLDSEVTAVKIEDPYIRSFHQCQNFLRLCELCVKLCSNLKTILLITSHESMDRGDNNVSPSEQASWMRSLAAELMKKKITLRVEYSSTLHDRQITLSSGWIIKIGRGLDFYKPPENKFTLGVYDLDFRPCHETTVDIFHSKNVKQIVS